MSMSVSAMPTWCTKSSSWRARANLVCDAGERHYEITVVGVLRAKLGQRALQVVEFDLFRKGRIAE